MSCLVFEDVKIGFLLNGRNENDATTKNQKTKIKVKIANHILELFFADDDEDRTK